MSAPVAFLTSGAALLRGSRPWLAAAGALISGVLCVLVLAAIFAG
jgi:hypothetical protein